MSEKENLKKTSKNSSLDPIVANFGYELATEYYHKINDTEKKLLMV